MPLTKKEKRDLRRGLTFISPWILGFSLFTIYPVGASLYYSFTDFSVLVPPVYIGAINYSDLLQDKIFWKTISNTFYYAMMALPLALIVSLSIAILLNQQIKFRGLFRTIYFLPSLVPLVTLAILWQWIFNGQYGVLNYGLEKILDPIGISPPNWLGNPNWTKPALVLTGLWGVGGAMVIYLAALQEVPGHLYEAAEIDGASSFQKFWHITLPMISPVIYFNLIMGIIGVLQVFAVPYVMLGQGPARSTYFFAMYIYNNAFKYLKMGYASAMSWIMFILILSLTLIATKITRKHIYYGGE